MKRTNVSTGRKILGASAATLASIVSMPIDVVGIAVGDVLSIPVTAVKLASEAESPAEKVLNAIGTVLYAPVATVADTVAAVVVSPTLVSHTVYNQIAGDPEINDLIDFAEFYLADGMPMAKTAGAGIAAVYEKISEINTIKTHRKQGYDF